MNTRTNLQHVGVYVEEEEIAHRTRNRLDGCFVHIIIIIYFAQANSLTVKIKLHEQDTTRLGTALIVDLYIIHICSAYNASLLEQSY